MRTLKMISSVLALLIAFLAIDAAGDPAEAKPAGGKGPHIGGPKQFTPGHIAPKRFAPKHTIPMQAPPKHVAPKLVGPKAPPPKRAVPHPIIPKHAVPKHLPPRVGSPSRRATHAHRRWKPGLRWSWVIAPSIFIAEDLGWCHYHRWRVRSMHFHNSIRCHRHARWDHPAIRYVTGY